MAVTFQQIRREAEDANILQEEEVQELLEVAAATSNQKVLQSILKKVQLLASEKIKNPFEQPCPIIDPYKEYIRIGTTHKGRDVRLPVDELTKHMLITGQSGAGKSDQIASLMHELYNLEVAWWAFDLKKDYRHLADDPRIDVLVIPASKIRLNPLRPPPNVSPNIWGNQVAKVFCDANRLLDASRLYLSTKISQVYLDNEVFEGGDIPTLRQLLHKVESDSIPPASKKGNYRAAVENRLKGNNSVIFDERNGYPLHELLDRNVVFELKGLDQNVQNFFMELMQAWIYMYRDTFSPSERSSEIDHVMIYDEGYMMYDQNKERETKSIPAVNQMTAQLRDFMEGLIVATQVPSQLTDFITANTNTKLILPSADWKQFKATGESFNFDRFQEKATWNIELSEGVVIFSSRGPFKVVLDHFDIEKTVSDDDLVQKYSSTYRKLLDAPSKEREKRLERQGEDKDSIGQRGRAVDKLSSEAVEILKDIAENPFRKTTTRYELLENVSTGKAHEYKAELVDHGLIKPVHVSTGSKVFKLFELTDRGLNTAREFKANIHTTGRGGLKHRFYQHKIKELLEDEAEVEIEGQDADVLASYEDREVAYEVAMSSSSREVKHVEKHLDNGIDEVVVCCADRKVLESLRDKVPDSDNVELKEIADIV